MLKGSPSRALFGKRLLRNQRSFSIVAGCTTGAERVRCRGVADPAVVHARARARENARAGGAPPETRPHRHDVARGDNPPSRSSLVRARARERNREAFGTAAGAPRRSQQVSPFDATAASASSNRRSRAQKRAARSFTLAGAQRSPAVLDGGDGRHENPRQRREREHSLRPADHSRLSGERMPWKSTATG
jgi:hypothetical protein